MNNSGDQPPNITCESKLEVIKQRIVWKIDNYSIRSKQKGECWFSDDFEFNGINGVTTNWELCLYPLGDNVTTGFVGFKLIYYGESIKAFYEVSARGLNDAKLYTSTPLVRQPYAIPDAVQFNSSSNLVIIQTYLIALSMIPSQ